jgi:hypothetical protein
MIQPRLRQKHQQIENISPGGKVRKFKIKSSMMNIILSQYVKKGKTSTQVFRTGKKP